MAIDCFAQIGTVPVWGAAFSEATLLTTMRKHGIEKAVISSTAAESCDFVRGNSQVAAAISANSSFAGLLVTNIHYPEISQKQLHAHFTNEGFVAIAVTSGAPGRFVTLAECDDILNAHRRFGKPVFLRVDNEEALLAANEIAKAFSTMKFVLLGMGGDDWRMAAVIANRTLNLILEVSGSLSPDKIAFAVEHVGAHRMVYGSGLPFVDPSINIELVRDCPVSDADKQMILEGSARRLFGWR